MKKLLCLILFCCSLIGCNDKSFETRTEMMAYLQQEEEGYLQKKVVNGIEFSLLYKPTDLLVDQELRAAQDLDIRSVRQKYQDYLYFNLSFSRAGKELLSSVPDDRNQFGAMVNQLAFGMNEKVHMISSSKDTIPMMDYVYPRLYGMSKKTSLLLVYPKDPELLKQETFTISIEDIGLFTGEVKFKIPTKIINEQPTMTF